MCLTYHSQWGSPFPYSHRGMPRGTLCCGEGTHSVTHTHAHTHKHTHNHSHAQSLTHKNSLTHTGCVLAFLFDCLPYTPCVCVCVCRHAGLCGPPLPRISCCSPSRARACTQTGDCLPLTLALSDCVCGHRMRSLTPPSLCGSPHSWLLMMCVR